MKSKIAFKITSVILILTCFLTAFHFKAFAENEFQIFAADAFKKSQPNLSGAIGELNIVPMQAILQGEEIQMTTEELDDGTDVVGKCIWTGHILDPHLTSVSNTLLHAIVFTCRNVTYYSNTSNRYNNISADEVWRWRIMEIVHETAHLFDAEDGYCEGIPEGAERCDNLNCYSCNKEPIPECIMAKKVIPNGTTDVFCKDCKETIRNHLASHH